MFHQRLLSTIFLWAVVLAVVFLAPPICSWALLALIGSLALWECYSIFEKANLHVMKLWGMLSGLALLAGSWFFYKHSGSPASWQITESTVLSFESTVLGVALMGCFVGLMAHRENDRPITPVATIGATMLGLIYVSWLFNFLIKIYFIEPACGQHGRWALFHGKYAVFYLILVTKLSDSGAYVVGSRLGRHKMSPRISPKKTWEGVAGAVITATLAGLGAFYLFRESLEPLHMTPLHAMIVGALIGAVSIMGDLAESIIKREASVKDSGPWFPGIGGVLDLIDSLLFTAPALYAYLRLVLRAS
jgi:phosphatidate cytidylyltransferase